MLLKGPSGSELYQEGIVRWARKASIMPHPICKFQFVYVTMYTQNVYPQLRSAYRALAHELDVQLLEYNGADLLAAEPDEPVDAAATDEETTDLFECAFNAVPVRSQSEHRTYLLLRCS